MMAFGRFRIAAALLLAVLLNGCMATTFIVDDFGYTEGGIEVDKQTIFVSNLVPLGNNEVDANRSCGRNSQPIRVTTKISAWDVLFGFLFDFVDEDSEVPTFSSRTMTVTCL